MIIVSIVAAAFVVLAGGYILVGSHNIKKNGHPGIV
jgi:hypothetical protein